uniref:Uncharacterized protein n=1 Tax=Kalanchoe fedtschenkoi TaxID=63787 RepID=A0A7N0TXP6_KALFE
MAVEVDDDDHHQPARMMYKGLSGRRQKVEALEREVAMLGLRLSNEQDVHEVLERAHKLDPGSAISIPSFVPPKVKQMLVELGRVNEEITRLERQIDELQTDLTLEQEMNRDLKSRDEQLRNSRKFRDSPSDVSSWDASSMGSVTPNRVSYEAKTLHFISKALKGDFTVQIDSTPVCGRLSDFKSKENESRESARLWRSGPRQKPPASPSQGSPRLQLTPKSSPSSTDTDGHRSQKPPSPNKLSESIMKCLIFIYVRLLRTARQNELEKSGGAAALRSGHSSSASFRSFRGDPANLKAIQTLQKGSRQQDPYGIFDAEDSLPRDIGPYKNLMVFGSTSLDLKCLSTATFAPLLNNLRGLLNNLRKVDLGPLTQNQKLAFWINMYNACVMHGFLQYGVPLPCSPEKLLNLLTEVPNDLLE